MKWVTRAGAHIDRAACAWLIRREIDPSADFVFLDDREDAPADAIPFDIPGAALSHHNHECSFETFLRHYELTDPVLWRMAAAVHEADLHDDRHDAAEATGLDILVRGLCLLGDDEQTLAVTATLFDGLYEYHRQAILLGREPA
jgi:hypothetical protein